MRELIPRPKERMDVPLAEVDVVGGDAATASGEKTIASSTGSPGSGEKEVGYRYSVAEEETATTNDQKWRPLFDLIDSDFTAGDVYKLLQMAKGWYPRTAGEAQAIKDKYVRLKKKRAAADAAIASIVPRAVKRTEGKKPATKATTTTSASSSRAGTSTATA